MARHVAYDHSEDAHCREGRAQPSGGAQKDTARELGAKLSILKGIVWVGVVMLLFGLATLAV